MTTISKGRSYRVIQIQLTRNQYHPKIRSGWTPRINPQAMIEPSLFKKSSTVKRLKRKPRIVTFSVKNNVSKYWVPKLLNFKTNRPICSLNIPESSRNWRTRSRGGMKNIKGKSRSSNWSRNSSSIPRKILKPWLILSKALEIRIKSKLKEDNTFQRVWRNFLEKPSFNWGCD